jgi:hypothetical protein
MSAPPTTTAPARVYRSHAAVTARLEAHRRLIVLAAVAMFPRGATNNGLEHGLKIMSRDALLGTLKTLEEKELVTSKLFPSATDPTREIRLWFVADGVSLAFDV